MKKSILIVLIISAFHLVQATNSGSNDKKVDIAIKIINLMNKGKFTESTNHFDTTMKSKVSPEMLKQIWNSIKIQNGDFIKIEESDTEKYNQYNLVYLKSLFSKQGVVFQFTFNKENLLSGFFLKEQYYPEKKKKEKK